MPKRKAPRREVSEQAILTAAGEAVGQYGVRVTLAQIGRKAGLSAGRLVQRYGSRSRLILAACEHYGAQNARAMAEITRGPSPLKAFYAWAAPTRAMTPDGAARFLEWVLMVRRDRALRTWYVKYLDQIHTDIVALLDAAVRAGELVPTDTSALATQVQQVMFGRIAELAVAVGRPPASGVPDVVLDAIRPYLVPGRFPA